MRSSTIFGAIVFLGVGASNAAAEQTWNYRGRVTMEAGTASIRTTWRESHLVVAAADGTWEMGRLKIAAGIVAADASRSNGTVTAREAYARASVASWMNVEAGKRLLRWGVGYGYAPTGVLDPPRDPADPADRFGRREGLPLVRADIFAGGASVSVAAASVDDRALAAVRVKAVVRGFDLSAIASARKGERANAGANVTHVIGERLAWHAEVLAHDGRGTRRAISAVAGMQYTAAGTNLVMEYHRREEGHVLFTRAARADAEARLVPELIVSRSFRDDRWTVASVLGLRATSRLLLHARAASASGMRSAAAGATARF